MKKMFLIFGLVIIAILSLVLVEEFNVQAKGEKLWIKKS